MRLPKTGIASPAVCGICAKYWKIKFSPEVVILCHSTILLWNVTILLIVIQMGNQEKYFYNSNFKNGNLLGFVFNKSSEATHLKMSATLSQNTSINLWNLPLISQAFLISKNLNFKDIRSHCSSVLLECLIYVLLNLFHI